MLEDVRMLNQATPSERSECGRGLGIPECLVEAKAGEGIAPQYLDPWLTPEPAIAVEQ